MKKYGFLLIIALLPVSLLAQKNVSPETRSALLNTDIPADAKKDKRFLSLIAVETILKMKTNPMQVGVKSAEYFFWRGDKIKNVRGVSIIDSIMKSLTADSWTMAYDDKDDTVVWLLKDNKPLLMMYVANKKEIDLYVGELDRAPAVSFQ